MTMTAKRSRNTGNAAEALDKLNGQVEALTPPLLLTPFHERLTFASTYCALGPARSVANTLAANSQVDVFTAGILLAEYDHCREYIHEAKVAALEYAAPLGGLPK